MIGNLLAKNKNRKINIKDLLVAQRTNDVVSMLLDGRGVREIQKYLGEKYNVKPSYCLGVIAQCREEIRKQKGWQVDDLINVHLQRYEDIYTELTKIKADHMAMLALKAKEKILQMHDRGSHMKVNGSEITQVSYQNVNADYDFEKLDEVKKERLNTLLEKLK